MSKQIYLHTLLGYNIIVYFPPEKWSVATKYFPHLVHQKHTKTESSSHKITHFLLNSTLLPLEDLADVHVAHLREVLGVNPLGHQVLHHLVPDHRQLRLLANKLLPDVAAVVLRRLLSVKEYHGKKEGEERRRGKNVVSKNTRDKERKKES